MTEVVFFWDLCEFQLIFYVWLLVLLCMHYVVLTLMYLVRFVLDYFVLNFYRAYVVGIEIHSCNSWC